MRTLAGSIAASVLASIACLCAFGACGQAPLATAEAVVSVRDTVTVPPMPVTVERAETANAAAFIAPTAETQAHTPTALTTPVRVMLPTVPSRASTATPPPPSSLHTPTPVPPTPTVQPTLGPAPTAYTAPYRLIRASDLTAHPEGYEDVPFSVIGYAYNVHARTRTMTFFLAGDEAQSTSIFVSFEGVDRRVEEGARIQVYGTGAGTIRVVTKDNVESDGPFMHAVMIRSAW